MNKRWRITPELFDRYRTGRSSVEERRFIDDSLDANPDAREALDRLVSGLGTNVEPPDVNALWLEANSRIRADEAVDTARPQLQAISDSTLLSPSHTDKPRYRHWYAFLALSCVALMLGLGSAIKSSSSHDTLLAATYTTSNAQRATVQLADGSSVTLGAASQLEVPGNYNSGTRSLNLNGRALFSVVHQGRHPFVVHAQNVTTRVLGTVFMVSSYDGDSATQVAVREGRVAANEVVLSAFELVSISHQGSTSRQLSGDSPFLFATGIMAIDSTPLSDAIPDLNRWYNVDIQLGDPALGRRLLEGKFPEGERADLVEVLEWMFHARAVTDGRTITLFPLMEK